MLKALLAGGFGALLLWLTFKGSEDPVEEKEGEKIFDPVVDCDTLEVTLPWTINKAAKAAIDMTGTS